MLSSMVGTGRHQHAEGSSVVRWPWFRGAVVGTVLVGLAAAVAAVLTLTDLERGPVAVLTLLVTTTGGFAYLGLTSDGPRHGYLWLALASSVAVSAVLAAVLFLPKAHPYELVVTARGSGAWPAVGEPAGTTPVAYVASGTAVQVDCVVSMDDNDWYRLANAPSAEWLPSEALRPRNGNLRTALPTCP
jgi:hypothetical protein